MEESCASYQCLHDDGISDENIDERLNEESNQFKSKKYGIFWAIAFILGENIGVGLIALPNAFKDQGYIGIATLPFFGFLAMYAALKLEDSYTITANQETIDDNERNQYGCIIKKAFGKHLQYLALSGGIAIFFSATLVCYGTIADLSSTRTSRTVSSPTFHSFAFSIGTFFFSYGATLSYPNIQHDMIQPSKFKLAVKIGAVGK
ncbi:DgyrCDS2544 [Dimorphilus gyrociliatus]|uniref:DgyrCDS2544 n=1 Tax=Dimorphilus gyrociliatus TaxID=2664684 RepID=A0A7I8VAM4_9ANNE|nr:DgyrCDS2544 [Dimorphilus gyrociliatus]